MSNDSIQSLVYAASIIAARGAKEYLERHNLKADPDALHLSFKAMIKRYLPGALADAKEAMACNMTQVAIATFTASMIQAGIDAAKEVGLPI